jgi:hypothetical protein
MGDGAQIGHTRGLRSERLMDRLQSGLEAVIPVLIVSSLQAGVFALLSAVSFPLRVQPGS